jgi:transposase
MNYNQNEKIAQITSQTLIIGVDIAKFKHVARVQDYRGMEFGSPCILIIPSKDFNCFSIGSIN